LFGEWSPIFGVIIDEIHDPQIEDEGHPPSTARFAESVCEAGGSGCFAQIGE